MLKRKVLEIKSKWSYRLTKYASVYSVPLVIWRSKGSLEDTATLSCKLTVVRGVGILTELKLPQHFYMLQCMLGTCTILCNKIVCSDCLMYQI